MKRPKLPSRRTVRRWGRQAAGTVYFWFLKIGQGPPHPPLNQAEPPQFAHVVHAAFRRYCAYLLAQGLHAKEFLEAELAAVGTELAALPTPKPNTPPPPAAWKQLLAKVAEVLTFGFSEAILNGRVFLLMSENPWITYALAVSVSCSIPWAASIIGGRYKQHKPVAPTYLLILAVLLGLAVLSLLRAKFIEAEALLPLLGVKLSALVAAVLLGGVNLCLFVVACYVGYAVAREDPEHDQLLRDRHVAERTKALLSEKLAALHGHIHAALLEAQDHYRERLADGIEAHLHERPDRDQGAHHWRFPALDLKEYLERLEAAFATPALPAPPDRAVVPPQVALEPASPPTPTVRVPVAAPDDAWEYFLAQVEAADGNQVPSAG